MWVTAISGKTFRPEPVGSDTVQVFLITEVARIYPGFGSPAAVILCAHLYALSPTAAEFHRASDFVNARRRGTEHRNPTAHDLPAAAAQILAGRAIAIIIQRGIARCETGPCEVARHQEFAC